MNDTLCFYFRSKLFIIRHIVYKNFCTEVRLSLFLHVLGKNLTEEVMLCLIIFIKYTKYDNNIK